VYLRAVCLVRAIADDRLDVVDEIGWGLMEKSKWRCIGMPKSGWLREAEWQRAGCSYLWAGGLCAVMGKAAALFAGTSVAKSLGRAAAKSVSFPALLRTRSAANGKAGKF